MEAIKGLISGFLLSLFIFIGASGFSLGDSCSVRWEGGIDQEFRVRAEQDLQRSCEVLHVYLNSPGGGVVETMEIAHKMRDARQAGMIIEIHGGTIIASGATFLIANGSKGFRYVRHNSLSLVHGIQIGGGFSAPVCSEGSELTDTGKAITQFRKMMAREYASASGRTEAETIKWLACDNTQAGDGDLLVELGLADHVEA